MREFAVFLRKCPKTFGQDCSSYSPWAYIREVLIIGRIFASEILGAFFLGGGGGGGLLSEFYDTSIYPQNKKLCIDDAAEADGTVTQILQGHV